MPKYLKASFRRKIAKRITKESPHKIEAFHVKDIGNVEFVQLDFIQLPINLQCYNSIIEL